MASITPYWDPDDAITAHAEGTVIGGKFVALSGPTVGGNPSVGQAGGGTTGLTTTVLGVAEHDATAGDQVTVATRGVWPIVAGANLTAGMLVTSDATGEAVQAAAGALFHGIALDDAADGADCPVRLQLNSSRPA